MSLSQVKVVVDKRLKGETCSRVAIIMNDIETKSIEVTFFQPSSMHPLLAGLRFQSNRRSGARAGNKRATGTKQSLRRKVTLWPRMNDQPSFSRVQGSMEQRLVGSSNIVKNNDKTLPMPPTKVGMLCFPARSRCHQSIHRIHPVCQSPTRSRHFWEVVGRVGPTVACEPSSQLPMLLSPLGWPRRRRRVPHPSPIRMPSVPGHTRFRIPLLETVAASRLISDDRRNYSSLETGPVCPMHTRDEWR